ncbi:MAG: hypothetical protein IJT59_00340 [Desulfovibrionaceae bacterium]|nr:hypothetical protein [Desulfovibrionaceae bacterium]
MVSWKYDGREIDCLGDLFDLGFESDKMFGFVYLVEFDCGKCYVGKKIFFHTIELPILKDRKHRYGHLKFVTHIRDGHKVKFEVVEKETNWLDYVGSCKEVEGLTPSRRLILEICQSKRELTYKEILWQFKYSVLENENFLNSNIGGKFFRGNLA